MGEYRAKQNEGALERGPHFWGWALAAATKSSTPQTYRIFMLAVLEVCACNLNSGLGFYLFRMRLEELRELRAQGPEPESIIIPRAAYFGAQKLAVASPGFQGFQSIDTCDFRCAHPSCHQSSTFIMAHRTYCFERQGGTESWQRLWSVTDWSTVVCTEKHQVNHHITTLHASCLMLAGEELIGAVFSLHAKLSISRLGVVLSYEGDHTAGKQQVQIRNPNSVIAHPCR